MNSVRRIVSYLLVAALGILLWNTWQKDHPPTVQAPMAEKTMASQTASNGFVPGSYSATQTAPQVKLVRVTQPTPSNTQGKAITVNTDLLKIVIDSHDGNIESAKLLKYPRSVKEKHNPMELLTSRSEEYYVAQANLTNTTKNGAPPPHHFFSGENTVYLGA